jgi:hypothetical protein
VRRCAYVAAPAEEVRAFSFQNVEPIKQRSRRLLTLAFDNSDAMVSIAKKAQIDQIVRDFDRDGIVLVEGLLNQPTLDAARVGVEWLMNNARAEYKWIRQRTYEWHREQPVFVELIEQPLVIGFAQRVLGEDFHLAAAQCSRNLRDDHYAPGAMKIHQDDVFFPKTPERSAQVAGTTHVGFTAMVYVQDTPLEMGPTQFIRGSHASGETFSDDKIEALPHLWRRAVPAGSLILFSHRTWHRGAPNLTASPRDLISNAYARRAIDKVQLTKKSAEGKDEYVAPDELLSRGSVMLRQLLHA